MNQQTCIISPIPMLCLASFSLLSGLAHAQWVEKNHGLERPGVARSLAAGGSCFYATLPSSLYLSDNNGASWMPSDSGSSYDFFESTLSTTEDAVFLLAQGVQFSVDKGKSWTSATSPGAIRAICTNGNSLYAATEVGRVYVSTDNALTWTEITKNLSDAAGVSIYAMAIKGATLFAGGWTLAGLGIFAFNVADSSWSAVNTGLTGSAVTKLTADGNAIYAGTDQGVFVSVDGITWSAVHPGLANGYYISTLLASDGKIFIGTNNGLILSIDGGVTWNSVLGPPGSSNVFDLTSLGSNVLAATQAGLFSSTDGVNWALSDSGIPQRIAVISAFTKLDNWLFAGSAEDGVYRSSDDGDNWTPVNAGLTTGKVFSMVTLNSKVFAGTDSGIFSSDNAGDGWSLARAGSTGSSCLAVDDTVLYYGDHTVYMSVDEGATWTDIATGIPTKGFNKIVTSIATQGSELFVSIYQGPLITEIWHTPDNGAHWSSSQIVYAPVSTVAACDKKVMVGLFKNYDGSGYYDVGGLMVSDDKASTWNRLLDGINVGYLYADSNIVVASTKVSLDGGVHWTTLSDNAFPNFVSGPYLFSGGKGIRSLLLSSLSAGDVTPTIQSFSPVSGAPGTSVTIKGTGFTNDTGVLMAGSYIHVVYPAALPAAVTAVTDTTLTFTVPGGAVTGFIVLRGGFGDVTSASEFQVTNTPTIQSFSPDRGVPGTSVTVTGTGFVNYYTWVTMAGDSAAVPATVSTISTTSLTFTVPEGAVTGPITVTVPYGGPVTSSTEFHVSTITEVSASFHERVSPNPTTHSLTVDLSSFDPSEEVQLTIYNSQGRMTGQFFTSDRITTISVESYAKGLYILQASQARQNFQFRFVKD